MEEVQGMRNGNAGNGQRIYEQNCATCHGENGQGAIGTGLNQRDFLGLASDQFILETIAKGRNNTAMPAWPEFSKEEVSDLLSFIRSWHAGPVYPGSIKLPCRRSGKRATLVSL